MASEGYQVSVCADVKTHFVDPAQAAPALRGGFVLERPGAIVRSPTSPHLPDAGLS